MATEVQQFQRRVVGTGAALAAAAVALGAFGAHGLRSAVEPRMLEVFETAARYHMYHALALIALGLAEPLLAPAGRRWSFVGLVFGTLVFSGTLYVMVLSGVRVLGAVTPIGGATLIATWVLIAWRAWR